MTPVSCRCRKPFLRNDFFPHGCGQCMPCRIKRRRLWVHRNLLESRMHGDSSFLTVTYDEAEHAKLENGSLDFEHHEKFLKKLRRRFTTAPIRYYGVGEYGERTGRAHFHYILYGYPTCTGARCQDKSGRYTCQSCAIAREAWGKGHIYLGDVTKDSISYVAGYVTKGWTFENEYNKDALRGRRPESARMSGAIGGKAIDQIAESFLADPAFHETFLGETGDVPDVLFTDGQHRPLGRYLRERFRKKLGWTDTGLPKEKLYDWEKELSALYEAAETSASTTKEIFAAQDKQKVLTDLSHDAILNIEAKFKKFNLVGAL